MTIIQAGTTLAVLVYFRVELARLLAAGLGSLLRLRPLESADSRLAWYIVLGTIPAAVLGKLLERRIEALGNWVIAAVAGRARAGAAGGRAAGTPRPRGGGGDRS